MRELELLGEVLVCFRLFDRAQVGVGRFRSTPVQGTAGPLHDGSQRDRFQASLAYLQAAFAGNESVDSIFPGETIRG